MKRLQREVSGGRRRFFRTVAGLGVAAGAGALILRSGAGSRPGSGQVVAARATGYRETDHVRKYYDTARG